VNTWVQTDVTQYCIGARSVASVGSNGDSYDNAMIESLNGLFKHELIYPNGRGQASQTSTSPPSNT